MNGSWRKIYLLSAVAVATVGWSLAVGSAHAESIDLGVQSNGPSCRAERDGSFQADQPQQLRLLCGASTTAIGLLVGQRLPATLPSEPTAFRAALVKVVKATGFSQQQAVQLICDSEAWQPAPAGATGEMLVASCHTSQGSFPTTLVSLVRGQTLIQGRVTPAALDTLARITPMMTGEAPLALAAIATAIPTPTTSAPGTAAGGLVREEDAALFEELNQSLRVADAREDHEDAEATSRKILALETRVLGNDHPGLADILMTMAVEVSAQRRYGEADKLFERATTLLGRTISPEAKARLLVYQAVHNINKRNFSQALTFASDAVNERRRSVADAEKAGGGGASGSLYGLGGNDVPRAKAELTHALMVSAIANSHNNRLPQAEAEITEAISLLDSQRGLPDWWKPQVLDILGRVYTQRGDYTKAEYVLTETVKQNIKQFGPSSPSAFALLDLAAVFDGQHRYVEGAKSYAAMLDMAQKASLGSSFDTDSLLPMVHTADALDRLDSSERAVVTDLAFRIIQWADHGVAGQTLTRTLARTASDKPDTAKAIRTLQDAEHARDGLRVEWASEVGKPVAEQSPERTQWLAEHYRAAATDAKAAEAEVLRVFPDYAEMIHPKVATVASTGALLAKDEALVLFEFGTTQGAAFVVTGKDGWVVPLAVGEEQLSAVIAQLRASVDVDKGKVKPFDLVLAHKLYQDLFDPIAKHLVGIKRLSVVTGGGALSSLPLSVLVATKPAAGNDYAKADWLINHVALTYQPSVQSFVAARKAPIQAKAPKALLAVGNPLFTGKAAADNATDSIATYCRDAGPMPASVLAALAPLPDTESEVRKVATSLGGANADVLVGAAASETGLREKGLDQYRVLYFATHGLLPAELHCLAEPGLALSPNAGAKSRGEDGLLEASEISDLRLNADLVVLSACNTANGGGEALSGLVSSFFHAGARAVLVSHWSVPSAATAALMSAVFTDANKQTLDVAVQAAEQSLIRRPETAHPVNWAAFVVVGNVGAKL